MTTDSLSRDVWRVSIPIILAQASETLLHLIDSIFLARVISVLVDSTRRGYLPGFRTNCQFHSENPVLIKRLLEAHGEFFKPGEALKGHPIREVKLRGSETENH